MGAAGAVWAEGGGCVMESWGTVSGEGWVGAECSSLSLPLVWWTHRHRHPSLQTLMSRRSVPVPLECLWCLPACTHSCSECRASSPWHGSWAPASPGPGEGGGDHRRPFHTRPHTDVGVQPPTPRWPTPLGTLKAHLLPRPRGWVPESCPRGSARGCLAHSGPTAAHPALQSSLCSVLLLSRVP